MKKKYLCKVYFGGKISYNDYRQKMFVNGDLRNYDYWDDDRYETTLRPIYENELLYNGPFFVSCDHRCFHAPDSHGVSATNTCQPDINISKSAVKAACLNLIDDSDIMFAWIDTLDCFGTIFEIGYAYNRIPIYIGVPTNFNSNDLWFVKEGTPIIKADSALDAIKKFRHIIKKDRI